MATVVTYNGSSFTIPATGEENWGGATKVDGFLIEVANNALQKSGGLFSLSGDLDFGPTAGLKSIYYKSRGTVSTAGVVRLAKLEQVGWRNNADSGNNLLTTDASDNLTYNGVAIASVAGVVPVASGGTNITSYSVGDILYASGATTLSKLAIGTANKVLFTNGTAPGWQLIVNANVDAAAAIAYSKLNLTGLVVNADIGAAAAIAYSKLNLTGLVVNADIGAAAAIAYSKLNLAGGILNADINASAAINMSKTDLKFATFYDMTEQGSTPASPAASNRRVYFKTDGKIYKLDSSGNEAEIGGASAGGINYILNPDAETGTTGWATYADAAAATPVDGTGGSPNVTWTRSTSSPLRGAANFLLTKDAANRQGEGASYAFTIASADKAKPLSISFEYAGSANLVAGSDSATGDVNVYIYDVTNAVIIQPAGFKLTGGTGTNWKYSGTFQSASNSTSYRLILHVAGTTATAWTLQVDNVVVGPQVLLYGAPISNWGDQAWTPTGSWSANSTYTGKWRRIGDSMHCRVKISLAGAPTSATLTVNMPSGYTIDTAKMANGTGNQYEDILGTANMRDSGVTIWSGHVVSNGTGTEVLIIGTIASGDARENVVTQAAPATWGNADTMNLEWVVPVTGWGSNVVMSQDTDTRVVAMRVNATTPTGTIATTHGSATAVVFGTAAQFDTHAGYATGTGKYTVPVAGYYRVKGQVVVTGTESANNFLQLSVTKNTTLQQVGATRIPVTSMTDNGIQVECVVSCVAGDTLELRCLTDIGTPGFAADSTANFFEVFRLSGPATIAVSETVAVEYTGNAGTVLTADVTNIDYSTKVKDTHGAFSGTVFTAPIAGFYSVTTMVFYTAVSAGRIKIFKSGSEFRGFGSAASDTIKNGACTLYLAQGDQISIRAATSNTLSNSATIHWLAINRVGGAL